MKQTILVNGCSRLFILHLVCLFSLSAVCRFTYTSVSIVAAFGMTHWNETLLRKHLIIWRGIDSSFQ